MLAVYCAGMVAVVLSPLNPRGAVRESRWFTPGVDYMLRMTEIDCLCRGVNPFDVWHGDVILKPYLPLHGAGHDALEGKEGFTEEINAYPPWEYVMMMPFALLPRLVSWLLYLAVTVAGVWLLFYVGRSFCISFSGGSRELGTLVGVASVMLVSLPILQNSQLGNLTMPVLISAVLMAICLDRGHDALAGVCWAFAMLKPQLGLAFAVPLLMMRRFRTCIVAVSVCVALSVIPAIMCHESPVKMILQGAQASSQGFAGCGTFPYFLTPYVSNDVAIFAGLVVGAVLCAFMTRRLITSGFRSWIVLSMPAAVTGAAWTYALCHSFAMGWFFFVVLCSSLVKWPKSKFLWVLAALSAVFMSRVFNFVHFLPTVFPGIVPEFPLLGRWHHHITTLNSTACILLVLAFSVWISRHPAKDMP